MNKTKSYENSLLDLSTTEKAAHIDKLYEDERKLAKLINNEIVTLDVTRWLEEVLSKISGRISDLETM